MRFVLAALLVLVASVARAAPEPPMVVVHTGYLLDGDDQPVSQTGVAMTFRLFALSAAVSGETPIWQGGCTVDVDHGHYTATLGKDCGNGLVPSMLPTGEERWLEVTIGTTTLAPRMLMGTVPTAATATNALEISGESLDDLDVRYARLAADASTPQTGSLAIDGAIAAKSIGTSGDGSIGGALSVSGSATVQGQLSASALVGDGAGLTNLDASSLSAGTLPDGRLAGTQSQAVRLTSADNQMAGTFSGHLDGSATGTFSGAFTGDGSALTGLAATALATGTIADARLPANLARLDADNSFSGVNLFSGRVGVGVEEASPAGMLDVKVDAGSNDGLTVRATDQRSIYLGPSRSSGASNGLTETGDSTIIFSAGAKDTGALVIAPWATGPKGLRMNAGGQVGIGLATPADWATLDVAGEIRGEVPTAASVVAGSGCTHQERRTWVAGGVSVTVPEDGRYLMNAFCRLYVSGTTSPSDNWWKCRVQDTTANTTPLALFGAGAAAGDGASSGDHTVSGSNVVALAKGDTLVVQYDLEGSGTGTYCLDGDGNGQAGLTLVRVGN